MRATRARTTMDLALGWTRTRRPRGATRWKDGTTGSERGGRRAAFGVDLDDDGSDRAHVPRRGAMTDGCATKAREIDGDGRDAEILERVETSGTASASAPGEAVWTPRTVDVRQKSPRQWSPIALAFLGDAVFELYARGVLFYPPAKPLDYDLKTKRLARAEAQDYLLRLLVDGGELSEDEISIVKWGRNAAYGNIPTRLKGKGKGGHGTYRNASALECLVGYLYVADRARLEEIMAVIMSESAITAATEV